MLLEVCKGNSLFIVNGRVGKYKNIGRFTCRKSIFVLNHSKILTFLILVNYIQMFIRLLRYVFSSDKFSQSCQNEYVDHRNHTVENIIKIKRQIDFQNNIYVEKNVRIRTDAYSI